jgi:hypothetical protein
MSGLVLTVHVHCAKSLGSGDSNVPCDPYCIVRAGELKPWRSKTVRPTTSPEWHALVTFDGCHPEHLPYLQIECWHEDGSSSDNPLGLVLLPTLPFLTELSGREVTVPCGRGLGKCSGLGAVVVSVTVVEQFPPVSLSPLLTTAAATFHELVARIDATADGTGSSLGSSIWAAGESALALDEALEAVCHDVLLGATRASAVPAVLYISSCRLLVMPDETCGAGDATAAAALAAATPVSASSIPTQVLPCLGKASVAPDARAAPLLCMPLHHMLRVEASYPTDASVGSSFLASRGRGGAAAAPARGGELHIHSLVREHVIRFESSEHGARRSSACALVHARLSFHLNNRERRCAPLVPRVQPLPNGRRSPAEPAGMTAEARTEAGAESARQSGRKLRSKSSLRGKSSKGKGSLAGVARGACEVEVSSFAREAAPPAAVGLSPVTWPPAPSLDRPVKTVQPMQMTESRGDPHTWARMEVVEKNMASAGGEGGAVFDAQVQEDLDSSVGAAQAAAAPGADKGVLAAPGAVAAAPLGGASRTEASETATRFLPLGTAIPAAAPRPVRAAASASVPSRLAPAPAHDHQVSHPLAGGNSSPNSACCGRGSSGSSGVRGQVSGSGRRRAGWDAFIPEVEWGRLRVERWGGWRRCLANAAHAICASYPRELIVPAVITDGALLCSARFRSKGRVPTLTWIDPDTGAALCRSSQPLVRNLMLRSWLTPPLMRGSPHACPNTHCPNADDFAPRPSRFVGR